MLYFLLAVIAISFWKIKINNTINVTGGGYLGKENSLCVKGIFILIIFFTHFSQYVTYTSFTDVLHIKFLRYFGQAVVAMFLFYSGYGVTEALKSKGGSYANLIPKHRILCTLVRFDLAVLLFALLQLGINHTISVSDFFLSLLTWHSLGNSNWYIFAIICAYGFSYLAYKLFDLDRVKHLTVVIILACMYVLIFWKFKLQGGWWYDTALCYPFGVFWSLYKCEIEKYLSIHKKWYYVCIAIALILFGVLKHGKYLVLLRNLDFVVLFVLFTLKVQFHSPILLWCGQNLFELYILQRIPMIFFKHIGLADFNIYLYFALVVITTIILVKPFQMIEYFVIGKLKIG